MSSPQEVTTGRLRRHLLVFFGRAWSPLQVTTQWFLVSSPLQVTTHKFRVWRVVTSPGDDADVFVPPRVHLVTPSNVLRDFNYRYSFRSSTSLCEFLSIARSGRIGNHIVREKHSKCVMPSSVVRKESVWSPRYPSRTSRSELCK